MFDDSPLWSLLASAAGLGDTSFADVAFAVTQVLPCAVLLAGWGLRPLAMGVRVTFGAVLLVTVTPSLITASASPTEAPLWVSQALSALPLGLIASGALWCASMTGNLLDELRASNAFPQREQNFIEATPLGFLLCLGATVGFLQLGGPSRIAAALQVTNSLMSTNTAAPLQPAIQVVLHSISVALAIAGPLIGIRLLAGTLEALLSRLVGSAVFGSGFSALTSLAHLTVIALLLDRLVEQLTLVLNGSF